METRIDSIVLEKLIHGRVVPFIYAFETSTIPNYLKVGDTYRPVIKRLDEWKQKYPNLKKVYETPAIINNDVFFRDYSVHKFFENNNIERLSEQQLNKFGSKLYFSNEFFKDISKKDVENAINHIKISYPNSIYDYYSFNNPRMVIQNTYERTQNYKPRPNQDNTINNFITAVDNGRNNLLMYAVMRFGKSVTSLWCAKKMGAKIVVVVSGKADVKEEWRKNLTSHIDFGEPEYAFVDSEVLAKDKQLISKTLGAGKRIVLFFTLQDFLKTNNSKEVNSEYIKEKHFELFKYSTLNEIDLLLIDETHYGVRAEKFSQVFSDESQDIEKLYSVKKTLKAKVVMHLSGTPYKILMNTEFKKEDIVSFYQFTDIVKDQESWSKNENNLDKDEWENPYYGFPQMIRFAFNPTKKSREILKKLNDNGTKCSISEIFRPKSINKDQVNFNHREFIYKDEVLDFLNVIDGKEDDQVLSFLNHPLLKKGQLCQHMVFVLPHISSCDAMKKLIEANKHKFQNLNEFEIINISGHEQPKRYMNEKGIINIKNDIDEFSRNHKKTITLTVNRMLTGSTVKQWDTMIYLKSGTSPQEYDQSIFRLQNPWIEEYVNSEGKIIKYNMKPQTILIDFDPGRMFVMLEEKAKIYNVNIEDNGNDKLQERIEEELHVSPIIHVKENKLVEITPSNILDYIRNYSNEKSVSDEAKTIPIDFNLLKIKEIENEIISQSELGYKGGLEIEPSKEENAIDLGLEETNSKNEQDESDGETIAKHEDDKIESLRKKFATYYSRILFFAFLTHFSVKSLADIIESLSTDENNIRIAENLDLKLNILSLMKKCINPFVLSSLEYKIQNINSLSQDMSLGEIERAQIAIKHFDRFSSSEIATPLWIAKSILDQINDEDFIKILNSDNYILDIASKSGEFAVEVYNRAILLGIDPKKLFKKIVSIPTSKYTYEFTRKTYEILGLNVDLIPTRFNTYSLLQFIKDNDIVYVDMVSKIRYYHQIDLLNERKEIYMKFDLIIGNPPYQDKGGSGGNNDAAIYQHFVNFAIRMKPKYNSMIIPARWFAAGRENLLGDFRKHMISSNKLSNLTVYFDASKVFKNVQIEGGVCHYLYNSEANFEYTNYTFISNESKTTLLRKLDVFDILVPDPYLAKFVEKVEIFITQNNLGRVENIISSDTPFGVPSNPKTSKKTPTQVYETSSPQHNTLLYHIENSKRKIEFVDRNIIKKNTNDIDKNKVFITGGYGGRELVLSSPELAPVNSICSQSYLYAAFSSKKEATNFIKYLKTKFFRGLVSAIKTTQSAANKVYHFVPILDFTIESKINWNLSVDEIDAELFRMFGIEKEIVDYVDKKVSKM